jgi:hypothetical protein
VRGRGGRGAGAGRGRLVRRVRLPRGTAPGRRGGADRGVRRQRPARAGPAARVLGARAAGAAGRVGRRVRRRGRRRVLRAAADDRPAGLPGPRPQRDPGPRRRPGGRPPAAPAPPPPPPADPPRGHRAPRAPPCLRPARARPPPPRRATRAPSLHFASVQAPSRTGRERRLGEGAGVVGAAVVCASRAVGSAACER